MEATFYTFTILALLGYIFGHLFGHKKILHTKVTESYDRYLYQRIWIPVKAKKPKTYKIKVKVYPNIGRKLAEDIEVVTEGKISADSYFGYSYSEILATLNREQIEDIKSLRSFLA
jgi:hypothetical protein